MKNIGGAMQGISPLFGMIPMVGGVLSTAMSIGGGLLEKQEAKKQAEQAERQRKEAMALKPRPIQKEYQQKLDAAKFASLSGMPGYDIYKNQLQETTGQGMRAARQTAPTGSANLEAVSRLNLAENTAMQDLMAKDAATRFGLQKEVRDTLAEVGGQKQMQQNIADVRRMEMLGRVAQLENAALYNRVMGAKNILGAIGKGANALAMSGTLPNQTLPQTQTTQPIATPETADLSGSKFTDTLPQNTSTFKGTDLTAQQAADVQTQLNELLAKDSLTESEKFTAAELRRLLKEYSTQ